MKKWLKFLLMAGGVGLIAGLALLYWIFNKPHRDVSKEKGIQLSAQQLYEAFRKDEAVANGFYLDKAIELSGTVADVSTNQEGQKVVNFSTDDPFFTINCTFKTDPGNLQPGDSIVFKGICTGYIPDASVVINEGVLVK
ncbi:MAG: OB-fold protein [Sediminibacterium sp.]